MAQFAQDVVDEICEYMNTERLDSCLYIVQGVADITDATSAELARFDSEAAVFRYEATSGVGEVRIEWPTPAVVRSLVQKGLFDLLDAASRK